MWIALAVTAWVVLPFPLAVAIGRLMARPIDPVAPVVPVVPARSLADGPAAPHGVPATAPDVASA